MQKVTITLLFVIAVGVWMLVFQLSGIFTKSIDVTIDNTPSVTIDNIYPVPVKIQNSTIDVEVQNTPSVTIDNIYPVPVKIRK